MSGRNALLQQIQQGKKLKKADTNDRSGPQVGKTGGGGSGPPMGMPRAPVPPVGFSVPGSSSRNGNDNGSSNGNGNGNGSIRVSSESRPAPAPVPVPAVPGLGGLFSGGIPKLRHRSGGVNTGRTSEDNGASPVSSGPPAAAPPPPPPPQQQTEQKTGSGGSRFTLPFRRSSHARSSSQADAASARSEAAQQSIYGAAKAPPPQPAFNGHSAVPGRRTSDAGAGLPPSSSPASRPGSSVSTKKAPPPPPPSSRKPQIKPKPQGLGVGRLASQGTAASSAAASSTPDLRGTLRPAPSSPINARSSAEEDSGSGGIIAESQGSVSSLAGMFGQRVKVNAGHGRTLTGSTFNAPNAPNAPSSHSDSSAHRRTGSTQAPSHLPPPPPPSLPRRASGAGGAGGADASSGVPVREGKWTFHALSDLPPPPAQSGVGWHVYPSGRSTGSTVALDL